MLGWWRPKLTYANVMVTALMFVVLGGGAYATVLAPKNSVDSRAIIDGQVKTGDLAASDTVARAKSLSFHNETTGAATLRPMLSGKMSADVAPIPANSCETPSFHADAVRTSDQVVVSGVMNAVPPGLVLTGLAGPKQVDIEVCNITTTTFVPTRNLVMPYLVLRAK